MLSHFTEQTSSLAVTNVNELLFDGNLTDLLVVTTSLHNSPTADDEQRRNRSSATPPSGQFSSIGPMAINHVTSVGKCITKKTSHA